MQETTKSLIQILFKAGFIGAAATAMLCAANLPNPALDENKAEVKSETAVFAGGCFWGIEAVFDQVKGVSDAVSGYAGGAKGTAHYDIVATGTTGHAESVQVTFDPSQISYGQLLKIYFSVHDPTELNRQDPDEGTQYRSEIFYTTPEQKSIAEAYIRQLGAAKVFSRAIVTKVAPLQAFYRAEDYHQDYVLHCTQNSPLCNNKGYVYRYDLPKVANFRQQFPDVVKGGNL
ncbi:MAG: peptide-methionine (S)-S-oxide reductase MsrA [Acidobacteriia bacterium]|nr:peptide-methionine (S)-S-oxide reductase MsrA [Terriglobia bacterium]MBV9744627.1 peptide-methionine (S)-S-oxide reductase MsrA [Terriglobia bacterium]